MTMRVLGVPAPPPTSLPAGGGTATTRSGGVLHVGTTTVSTDADLLEKDLWTYTLPANTLNENGRLLRITVTGRYASNANNKTIRLYVGGSAYVTQTTASNGVGWTMTVLVIRTAAAVVLCTDRRAVSGATISVEQASAVALDTTADVIIKATGQNGSASASDVSFRGAMIEFL